MFPKKAITRKDVHFWFYYGTLCLLVIALPSSRFLITTCLVMLGINWVAEGNFKEKLRVFWSYKPAVAFSLLYAGYMISLAWSVDVDYALTHDLLHKSPTFFMPLILLTSPRLDIMKLRLLLVLFIATVLTVSLIGFSIRLINPDASYRDASPFMYGIFLGTMLLIAAFQLPLLVRQLSSNRMHFWLSLAVSAWLIFFIFYIRALSGIASLAGVSLYLLFYSTKRIKRSAVKVVLALSYTGILLLIIWPLQKIYRQTHAEIETDLSSLPAYTEDGNLYRHDTCRIIRENGNLVYINISDQELEEAWNQKSGLDYHDNDLSGYEVKHTLYRYMSSMGLKKNKKDFAILSDEDIRAIEQGVPNYMNVNRPGIYIRIYEEMSGLYLYRKSSYTNPSWASFSQRVDLWRASLLAFPQKPIFGWGTGSIRQAVDYGFEINNSPLQGKNMKPHNQYLYILLTQGIAGLLAFLIIYLNLVAKTKAWKNLMFRIFFLIFFISFLGNNLLEHQVGQNLFVFFTLIYCFLLPMSSEKQPA